MRRRWRLRRSDDFQRLRVEGLGRGHSWFTLSYAPNALPHNRYGIIVTKRLGNAVTRNRIRRQLREALRLLHPRLRAGYDVVTIARFPLIGQPFAAIHKRLYEQCKQAGLVQE